MLSSEKIKEIAERYGIVIEPAENGKGGYIDDETGELKNTFFDDEFGHFWRAGEQSQKKLTNNSLFRVKKLLQNALKQIKALHNANKVDGTEYRLLRKRISLSLSFISGMCDGLKVQEKIKERLKNL